LRSKDALSMFVDITGRRDRNQYVVGLTAACEGLGGVIRRQAGSFSCFLLVVLLMLIERVRSSVFSFIDVAPRYDDVTMLAVQRTGGGLSG
jgi:hypothetical protein